MWHLLQMPLLHIHIVYDPIESLFWQLFYSKYHKLTFKNVYSENRNINILLKITLRALFVWRGSFCKTLMFSVATKSKMTLTHWPTNCDCVSEYQVYGVKHSKFTGRIWCQTSTYQYLQSNINCYNLFWTWAKIWTSLKTLIIKPTPVYFRCSDFTNSNFNYSKEGICYHADNNDMFLWYCKSNYE